MAVPLLREDHLLGGLVVYRNSPGEFDAWVIDLLKTFATQSALAIQNARLFREIEEKSRELATASRHKSEFLANMSHELRTPLNAIIGFSEVLAERMFGEINDKQAEYLSDILESGRHLLSLINDILDLSKIEAGRMELEPTDFDLPSAIESTLTLVRERAHRHGITLARTVDERLGMVRADERKVKQVLLNLLSNALKFTPEGGRIDVRAGVAQRRDRDFGEPTPGWASRPRIRRRCLRSSGRSGQREEGGRHRARAGHLTEVHRAPRRKDLGQESRWVRLDFQLHAAGAMIFAGRRRYPRNWLARTAGCGPRANLVDVRFSRARQTATGRKRQFDPPQATAAIRLAVGQSALWDMTLFSQRP